MNALGIISHTNNWFKEVGSVIGNTFNPKIPQQATPPQTPSARFRNGRIIVSSAFHLNIGKHLSFRDNFHLMTAIQDIAAIIKKLDSSTTLPKAGRVFQLFPKVQENEYLQSRIFEIALQEQHPFIKLLTHINDNPTCPRAWNNIQLVDTITTETIDKIANETQTIESVDFTYQIITQELIHSISKLGNIKQLKLRNPNVTRPLHDDALVKVICDSLPQLEKLSLPEEQELQGDFLHLLPKTLTSLLLHCGEISSDKLQCLMQLRSLKSLHLIFNKPQMRQLFQNQAADDAEEDLSLQSSVESDKKPTQQLVQPLQLESFIFSGNLPLSILNENKLFIDPTSLKNFQFINAPIDDSFAQFLKQCSKLQSMKLCAHHLEKGGMLQIPTHVEKLDLSKSTLSENVLKQLPLLEKLRYLDVTSCKGIPLTTEWISTLPKSLETLILGCVVKAFNSELSIHLSKLPNLTKLCLCGCHKWEPTNEIISSLPKTLQHLTLDGCNLSVDACKGFENLSNLVDLDITNSNFDKDGLNSLPNFLTSLRFTKINDWSEEAFQEIAHYKKLNFLAIGLKGKISCKFLEFLPPTLEQLYIVADEFSEDAIQYLESLSNLKVFSCYPRKSIPNKFAIGTKKK